MARGASGVYAGVDTGRATLALQIRINFSLLHYFLLHYFVLQAVGLSGTGWVARKSFWKRVA